VNRHALLNATLLCALAAAGCDRFPGEDHGPPRILRAMAYDASSTLPPVVTPDDPDPADMRLTDVPLEHARFRVEVDKPLDGATIQLEPGADLCAPSPHISLTRDGAPVTAEVCYEPGGTSPSITISPATLTCHDGAALPSADDTLQSGSTYVVTGTGVRDLDGHALDFRLTVVAAAFAPRQLLAETSYDASGAVAETVDLAAGPGGIPPGILDAATGLFTAPTYTRAAGLGAAAGSLFYGTGFSVVFPSLMPGPGSEPGAGIDTAHALAVGGQPVEVELIGDAAARDRLHLVPRLPLEDGATYSLAVAPPQGGLIADALGNATASALGPFSFSTPQAAPRVVWQYPVDGEGDVYPVLDERLQAAWSGRPFLGIATGGPFGSATAELVGPDGPVPDVASAPFAGDGRARTVSLRSTSADPLALAPGTVYAMRWAVDGALTGSSSFRTLDFAGDARWPGFAGQVRQYANPAEGYAPIASGAVGIPVASRGQAVPYLVSITGRVAHADDPSPPTTSGGPAADPASRFAFLPLAEGTDVRLYRGAFDPAAANTEVPLAAGGGMKGFARTFLTDASTARDPWADGAYPGSLVGVVPDAPLDFGQRYTLVADVEPAGGSQVLRVELPFTTTTFRVAAFEPPDPGDRWSAANPLLLKTTGVLDPASLGTPSGLDGPVQVFAGAAQVPIAASTPAPGQPGEDQWILVQPLSDGDVPFAATCTVIATPALSSRGAAIERFSGSFTTPPERDAQGGLVCR
jgi:hypothetical protein